MYSDKVSKSDLGIYFTVIGSKSAVYKQSVVSASIQLKAGHTYLLIGRNGISIPSDGLMSAMFDVSSDTGSTFYLGDSRTTMSNGGGCYVSNSLPLLRNGNDYKNSKKLHRKFNRLRVC